MPGLFSVLLPVNTGEVDEVIGVILTFGGTMLFSLISDTTLEVLLGDGSCTFFLSGALERISFMSTVSGSPEVLSRLPKNSDESIFDNSKSE